MKKSTFLIGLAMTVLMTCVLPGCGAKRQETKPEPQHIVIPASTSDELRLYIVEVGDRRIVVDYDGHPAADCTVTDDGSIADKDGNVLVAADNATAYVYPEEIMVGVDKVELPLNGEPVMLEVTVLPENTTNKAYTAEVVDDAVAMLDKNTVMAAAEGETVIRITADASHGTLTREIPVNVTAAEAEDPAENEGPAGQGTEAEPVQPAPEPAPAPQPEPVVPVHTHSYKEYSRTEPTCTADGKIVSKCSCGDTKTQTISKLGHDYKESSRTEPTCSSEGKVISKCSRCGATTTQAIDKLEHDWVDICEEIKYEHYGDPVMHCICNGCGADVTEFVESDGLSMHDHYLDTGIVNCLGWHSDWVWPVIGYDVYEYTTGYQCARCGETREEPEWEDTERFLRYEPLQD